MSSKKPVKPGSEKPKTPAKPKVASSTAADKKVGIVLFVVDACFIVGAVALFVLKPSCGSETGDDKFGYGDAQAGFPSGQAVDLQFHGHQQPTFNQFQPSGYGAGGSHLGVPNYGSTGHGGGSVYQPAGPNYGPPTHGAGPVYQPAGPNYGSPTHGAGPVYQPAGPNYGSPTYGAGAGYQPAGPNYGSPTFGAGSHYQPAGPNYGSPTYGAGSHYQPAGPNYGSSGSYKPPNPIHGSSVFGTGSNLGPSGFWTGPSSNLGSPGMVPGSHFGGQGTGSSAGFGPGSSTGGQISGVAGSNFYGQGSPIPGGQSSPASEYPYEDIADVIPEDRFRLSPAQYKCGVQATKPNLKQGRIVGGSVAIPHSWPWFVQFLKENAIGIKGPHCGGSVITPRHILTAAHCFGYNAKLSELECNLGSHDQNIRGRTYKLKKLRIHPESDTHTLFDYALVTLAEEIQFSDKVQMVCLPSFTDVATPGRFCYSYGFGLIRHQGYASKELKQIGLQVQVPEKCSKIFHGYNEETSICAGHEVGQDTCQGDSGGPFTCQDGGKWILYGLVSFGGACAMGKPAVYAKISAVLEWLCCFIADLPSCDNIECNPGAYN